MHEQIIETIRKIDEAVPVVWDRFTENDGYYVVYGWIARADGQRDIVIIQMWYTDLPSEAFYFTSSAKFSETLSWVLEGHANNHVPCRRIEELYQPIQPSPHEGAEFN